MKEINMGLASLIAEQIGTEGVRDTSIPGIQVGRFSRPLLVERCTRNPSLAFVAQGSKRVRVGDQAFTYQAGSYLVGALHLPIKVAVTSATKAAPYLGLVMELDLAELSSMDLTTVRSRPTQTSAPFSRMWHLRRC